MTQNSHRVLVRTVSDASQGGRERVRLVPVAVLLGILIVASVGHAQIGNLGPIDRRPAQSRKPSTGGVKLSVAIQPAIGSVEDADSPSSNFKSDLAILSLGVTVQLYRKPFSPEVAGVFRAGALISGTFLTDDPGGDFVDRFEEFSAILGPEVAIQLGTDNMPLSVAPFVGVGVGPSYERLLSPYSSGFVSNDKKFGFTTGVRFGVEVTPRDMPIAFAIGAERHTRDFDAAFYDFFSGQVIPFKFKLKHSSTFLAIRFMFNQ